MQLSQCALGTLKSTFPPYNFSTGWIGHKLEHHALFHSKKKLMVTPITAIAMIIIPVATPLLLNNACRKGTITNSAITAAKLSMPSCFTESFLRCEKA
ncbi:MAG TPA: hypothetical protein DCO83_15290 [Mucilaginibacter sp.]|nr:hypothetical protein [Mucilaginibacter sp.]